MIQSLASSQSFASCPVKANPTIPLYLSLDLLKERKDRQKERKEERKTTENTIRLVIRDRNTVIVILQTAES